MEESRVEKALVREVKKIGGRALKFVSPGTNGVPDRIVLLPGGRVVFVELKAKDGRPSKRQLLRHRQFRALGFQVYVINSNEEIEKFIKEVKE
jgi:hypothetical protein